MSDYISRRAAIKAIDDLPNCYNGYSDTYDKAYIIGVLEEVPTIEPKRGKWIVQDTSYWRATHAEDVQVNRLNLKCSLCGWRNHERKDYNYCPNCGAKMERNEE